MPFTYQAPNPYPPTLREKFVGLFPDWSSSSSASLADVIVPAVGRRPKILGDREKARLESGFGVGIDEGWVSTHDGARLQTIQVDSKQADSHRYIVKFNGNGGLYQDLVEEYAEDAASLNASVIGFNYRGVGKSELTPTQYYKLVTDGIAQVNRLLLEKGVSPDNILLDGHSLGGSVAVMVAKHFHDKGIKVFVWNDRSFSSLARAAGGIVANVVTSLPESSLACSSYSVLKPLGWQVDAANAYKKIPYTHKGYMVVDKASARGEGDAVIAHKASLHEGVRKSEEKLGHKTGHSFFHPYEGGHNLSRKSLNQCDEPDTSAQTVYENFVKAHLA